MVLQSRSESVVHGLQSQVHVNQRLEPGIAGMSSAINVPSPLKSSFIVRRQNSIVFFGSIGAWHNCSHRTGPDGLVIVLTANFGLVVWRRKLVQFGSILQNRPV